MDDGPDQLHRAVLGFELMQLGMPPSAILRLIADFWDSKLRAVFARAETAIVDQSSDVILVLAGVSLAFGAEPIPNINHITADKLMQRLTLALDGEELPPRALLVNLTAQLRKFHTSLAHYHLLPDVEVVLEPVTKPKSWRAPKRAPRSRVATKPA